MYRVIAGDVARAAVAAAVVVLLLSGCGGDGGSGGAQPDGATGTAETTTASGQEGAAAADGIPAGREIAEGGGGPVNYTFREEWRRGLAAAQQWRPGAYLITASGDMINDDGVPSSWRLLFIDKVPADTVLMLDMDPWGKVTDQREVTGGDVASFVGDHTKAIPYEILDSDAVVSIGKAALGERLDLAKAKDPRVGLNFSEIDGSGPYWTYSLFNTSNAEYVMARIDAITGTVVEGD